MATFAQLIKSLDRSLGFAWRWLRRLYKGHFALFMFCVAVILQSSAAYLRVEHHVWQWLPFTLILFVCGTYYAFYFKAFSTLMSATHRHVHLFAVYSTWGVVAFSFVFVFTLAQVLHVLNDHVFPIVTGTPSYFAFVKFCIFKIVNIATFDLLETFNFTSWRLDAASRDGRWITYFLGVFAEMVLISVLIQQVRRVLIHYPLAIEEFSVPPDHFKVHPSSITPDIVNALRERANSRDYSNYFEENVSGVLTSFKTAEASDIYLNFLEHTKSERVFKRCVYYFKQTSRDRRYHLCLERALSSYPPKQKWIGSPKRKP